MASFTDLNSRVTTKGARHIMSVLLRAFTAPIFEDTVITCSLCEKPILEEPNIIQILDTEQDFIQLRLHFDCYREIYEVPFDCMRIITGEGWQEDKGV